MEHLYTIPKTVAGNSVFQPSDEEAEGHISPSIPLGIADTIAPLARHPLSPCYWTSNDITDADWPEEKSKKFWEDLQIKKWSSLMNIIQKNKSLPYIRLLKYLLHLTEQNDHEKDISIIDFIRLTKYFGPFARESDGSFQCLNTLKALTDERNGLVTKSKGKEITCFLGYAQREEAINLLQKEEIGSYYIRFSSSGADEGTFVLEVKASNVESVLIQNDFKRALTSQPFRQFLKLNGDPDDDQTRTYSSLGDLIRNRLNLPLDIQGEVAFCTNFGSKSPLNIHFSKYKSVK